METTEQWVQMDEHFNYQISSFGRIKNITTSKYVGSIGKDGYMHFSVIMNNKYKNIRIHKLVWKYFKGLDIVEGYVIDHINNIKSDNNIDNLQVLRFRQNIHKGTIVPKSGVIGVSWSTQKQRWCAEISLKDSRYRLRYRRNIEECKSLYDKALFNYEQYNKIPYIKKRSI